MTSSERPLDQGALGCQVESRIPRSRPQLERPQLRPDRGSPTRKTIASPDHSDVMVDVGPGLLVSSLSNSGFLAAPRG